MKISDSEIAALYESGVFDAQWYLAQYPDVAALEMSPARHYLWLGRRLGRRASAWDPGRDHIAAPALSAGQRRLAFTQGVGETLPLPDFRNLSQAPSIAVAVHLYYSDLIDEFCRYLANIPFVFTGLFSIRDDADIPAINAALERYGVKCRPVFRVMQNRGRNFGPFLVDFRKEIAAHDLMLHIHTKKSLRVGREETSWRAHLLDGLLGAPALVGSIIETFMSSDRAGLLFPETWPNMAIWCHHWLSCSHRVDEISDKLGIGGLPRRGMIDLSVGGMFWARTDALAPLLAHPWSYDEFEIEPIADDGSLAHVLERALAGICNANGYDYYEMDAQNRLLRRNWSEKLLHRYRDALPNVRWLIDNTDTVSFDFFDTLFARNATTPEDVQSYIGWVLQCRNLVGDEALFLPARKAAEARARDICDKGDVDIDDIYGAWKPNADWSARAIAAARDLEWNIEARTLVPRPDVIALARAMHDRHGRVVITSDTYMPPKFFADLLEAHGVAELFDAFYISNVLGKRKDRGDIWPYLVAQEGNGRRLHHFGDNEHSDMQVANRFGVPQGQVLNTTSLAGLMGFGPRDDWRLGHLDWRDGLIHGPLIARFCADAFPQQDSLRPLQLSDPVDIGYVVLGPLFFGFLTSIMDQVRRNGITSLHFLAREGWFLHRQYESLRVLMGAAGSRLPEGRYLSVSRRAALGAAAATHFDPAALLRGSGYKGTFSGFLLARLGYAFTASHPLASRRIDTDANPGEVLGLLTSMKDEIVAAARPRRERMLSYLAQTGVDEAHSMIVDIGYSGTIQSALQSLTERPLHGMYMVTSAEIDSVLAGVGHGVGVFSDRGAPSVVRDYSMILEAILTAPHGQTLDYHAKGPAVEPIYGANGVAQQNFAYLAHLNDGATAYISDMLRIYGPEIALATFAPDECDWGLRAIVSGVLKPDERFWEQLHVEDQFCGNEELKVRMLYRM